MKLLWPVRVQPPSCFVCPIFWSTVLLLLLLLLLFLPKRLILLVLSQRNLATLSQHRFSALTLPPWMKDVENHCLEFDLIITTIIINYCYKALFLTRVKLTALYKHLITKTHVNILFKQRES